MVACVRAARILVFRSRCRIDPDQRDVPDRFFISSLPHETLGEKVVLLIETKVNGPKELGFYQDAISGLKTLHNYEMPKEIFLIEKFQETSTKKIQRKKTLDLLFD